MAETCHTSPTALEIETQTRWEIESVERGVRRYREFINSPTTQVADTTPGQTIMREVMKHFVPAVEATQEEAKARIAAGGAGRQSDWWWLIQLVEADKLAYLTLRAALSIRHRDNLGAQRKATSVALEIGANMQLTVDFEQWKANERAKAKLAREAGEPYANLFEALKRRVKKVDARAFKRWGKKLQALSAERWSQEARIQVGIKLLDMMVEHGAGWFSMVNVPLAGGKTERRLVLSDLALEAISDINTRQEVARPMLMPMVCPPKPWVRAA